MSGEIIFNMQKLCKWWGSLMMIPSHLTTQEKSLFTQNNLFAACGNHSYSNARWQAKIRVGTALPVWQLIIHTHTLVLENKWGGGGESWFLSSLLNQIDISILMSTQTALCFYCQGSEMREVISHLPFAEYVPRNTSPWCNDLR